jgi:hypothetical protein
VLAAAAGRRIDRPQTISAVAGTRQRNSLLRRLPIQNGLSALRTLSTPRAGSDAFGGGGTPHRRGIRRSGWPGRAGPATNSRPAVSTGANRPGAIVPPLHGSLPAAAPNRSAKAAAEASRR